MIDLFVFAHGQSYNIARVTSFSLRRYLRPPTRRRRSLVH